MHVNCYSVFVMGLLLACCLDAAYAAAGPEDVTLRVPSQINTEPKYIERRDQRGKHIVGECIDILRAIEGVDGHIHFSQDQTWVPSARIESAMRQGQADGACGLTHTPERDRQFKFLPTTLFTMRYHLVVRKDDPIRINSWDDVRALGNEGIILVVHGFGPVQRLQLLGGLHVDAGAADTRSNLSKLLLGRGRFYYHRIPGLQWELRRAGVTDKVRVLPTVMDTQPFFMVLTPELAPAVQRRVSRALELLDANGELQRIRQRWEDDRNLDLD